MKHMRLLLLAVAAALSAPGAAFAAPANATGVAQANVVVPASIVPLVSLRFGQFTRPTAAGTLTIDIAGAVTATGGAVGTFNIPQLGLGRGPGTFSLTGGPNRAVSVTLPTSITIANGTQTMTVNNFTANTQGNGGKILLNRSGTGVLIVGARLNIGANQAVGNYTGTYNVTVVLN